MNKDSIIDYLACILFRLGSFLARTLPCGFRFFLGARLGDCLYYFDLKHRVLVYANLKKALGEKIFPDRLKQITKEFYQGFGQSLTEIFWLPCVDKEYLAKYITFEGKEHLASGFKKGKGVILAVVHEGNWEIANIISANLGYPFSVVVRNQARYPRLSKLLNLYRAEKGTKLIQKQNQIRELIRVLRNNEAIALTIDQGGKNGVGIKFFAQDTSMSTGAVRLALEYGSAIIPVFSVRLRGPYTKIIFETPLEVKETQDKEKNIEENLQKLICVFEKYISLYPKEYLWNYKIWKYSQENKILILSDTKAGHLRQAEAAAGILLGCLRERNIRGDIEIQEVKFKNKFLQPLLALCSLFGGKYSCQGCAWCLKNFLERHSYNSLISSKPDIIISCGSSLAPVNFLLSRENLAKSIAIMRPGLLSTRKFNLVIMPKHDQPAKKKNVAVTEGALNLINEEYLKDCISHIAYRISQGQNDKRLAISDKQLSIGLLIGGGAKRFHLEKNIIAEVIRQLKYAAENLGADIMVTTSRRTSSEIERLCKEEFKDYPRCKLLVIANEKNIPQAVGGILGLSQIIIISPESISMISEAANSKKYVFVFHGTGKYKAFSHTTENRMEVIAKRFSWAGRLSRKHCRFIGHFAINKYIYLTEPSGLKNRIEEVWRAKPPVYQPKDNLLVGEAIKRIL